MKATVNVSNLFLISISLPHSLTLSLSLFLTHSLYLSLSLSSLSFSLCLSLSVPHPLTFTLWHYLCLNLLIYLIYLFIYLFIYLSIYVSIFTSTVKITTSISANISSTMSISIVHLIWYTHLHTQLAYRMYDQLWAHRLNGGTKSRLTLSPPPYVYFHFFDLTDPEEVVLELLEATTKAFPSLSIATPSHWKSKIQMI